MNEPRWKLLLEDQVERNSKFFYQMAFRILRDDAAARDVCQQAFFQAWKNQDRIEPSGGTLKRWVAKTVITGSLKRIRDGKAERRALARHATNQSDSPDDPWEQEELRDAVLAAISRLPEPMQSIVVLRKLQGMAGNEVKEMLGCSASEVSRQLHRGLEELRVLLSGETRDTREAG